MRIAYVAPYQGPALVNRRPVIRNFSLGGRAKVQLIAELLQKSAHDVEILSQGEVIDYRLKVYPEFREPESFHASIPVFYSSAFPVKYLNGTWSSLSLLRLFKARHRVAPFDLVLFYNLKPPQVACATYARRHLGLPIVLEYEDDSFVDAESSQPVNRFSSRWFLAAAKRLLNNISGCVAVSPYLLSRVPSSIPTLLLRGVVGDEIVQARAQSTSARKNWVVFSGTHFRRQGLLQLIEAWKTMNLPGWELHIAGHGEMTSALQESAANHSSIVFHGLLSRQENARLLCTSTIAIVPRDVDDTPGNVFAFKIVECLAAGLHVVTTPMGTVEPEIAKGISYIRDNSPEAIATGLQNAIATRSYERRADQAAVEMYGAATVSKSLNVLIDQVKNGRGARQAPALKTP